MEVSNKVVYIGFLWNFIRMGFCWFKYMIDFLLLQYSSFTTISVSIRFRLRHYYITISAIYNSSLIIVGLVMAGICLNVCSWMGGARPILWGYEGWNKSPILRMASMSMTCHTRNHLDYSLVRQLYPIFRYRNRGFRRRRYEHFRYWHWRQ